MAPTLVMSLSELPEYRRALLTLVARDLKVKYQTKALGFLWSLVYPALMISIWYAVFRGVLKVNMPNYWAYLIVGMLPFQFVQNAVLEGSSAVRKNAGLIRKVYIPMEILVIAGVTVKLVEFLAQLAVAVLVLAVAHHAEGLGFSLWRTLVVLPSAVLLIYIFALGVSLPLAAWTVMYRDLEHMVTLALMMLIYLTPIFWNLSFIEGSGLKWAFMFNPLMHLIDLFRGPLYWGSMPSLWTWGPAIAFASIAFVGGYLLFDRSKHVLAEVV